MVAKKRASSKVQVQRVAPRVAAVEQRPFKRQRRLADSVHSDDEVSSHRRSIGNVKLPTYTEASKAPMKNPQNYWEPLSFSVNLAFTFCGSRHQSVMYVLHICKLEVRL